MNIDFLYDNIDIDKLYELVNFLIKKYNLEDLVNKTNIIKEMNDRSNANYNLKERELKFYIESIGYSFNVINYYTYRLNPEDIEYKKLYAIFIMENILHELTHVIQFKDYISNRNDSIGKIIKEEIDIFFDTKDNDKLYRSLYNYMPIERNANCNAKKLLIDLNNEYGILKNGFESNVLNEYKKELNSKYFIINPCMRYFILRNKFNEYKELSFNENYDLETCKSWGLPLLKKKS